MNIRDEINRLKKERNAIILAHIYQSGEIQETADITGDSYGLSQKANDTDADVIVFCGVTFMAESAKILSPEKTVLLPNTAAGCPMADMVGPMELMALKNKYPDATVVSYVNTTAEVKALSDICCTSSNAIKVVQSVKTKQVIFLPDENLGRYVAERVPEKEVILYSGCCPTHHRIKADEVKTAKDAHPNAIFLVHPECRKEVVEMADFVGSTAQILNFAKESEHNEFIIGTEKGVLHPLIRDNPEKEFYMVSDNFFCPNMKKTSLEDLYMSLKYMQHEVILDEDIIVKAKSALDKMLAVK